MELSYKDNQDIYRFSRKDKEFIIVGTAHVSQQSADLVRTVIEEEKPDTVCVELDTQRFKALNEKQRWENLDLKQVIREKQLTTLLVNLLLASYQKRMGDKLGVMPGVELLEATKVATKNNIPVELCDRDVRITLRRAWNSMSAWEKFKLMASGMAGIFEEVEVTEEDLSELRERDALNELMQGLGEAMPKLKTVLIDERDTYLTQKMKQAEGNKIVAIVGAGHVQGILKHLEKEENIDLTTIEKIPKGSSVWKWIGWGIPAIIIGSILYIGWTQGATAAGDNALYWFLANGIPAALGALLAFGHPLTVLASFFGAPFTSLTPVIGAGYVAAFVQAYFKPPVVKEFQVVSEEIGHVTKWWKNKLLRVFLVFILSSLGSVIGTYVGGFEILSNLK